ncbi:ATP-binding protein [Methanocella sp. MCL-LM]|uniref:ATP-binding protein n=1 Tax=Methanocella sp. MCL-LM TaxID=3412035 RepID=UPI003C731074
MVEYRKYVVGLLVSASTIVALYVNLFLGIDTVYTHLFYVPVVLTAIWYYWKSVYLAGFLSALHISMGVYLTGTIVPGTMIRAFTLLVVALIVAMLSEASSRHYSRIQQSSEEDLKGVFNSVDEAIFIHDMDGKIVEVNDRATQIYGVPRDRAMKLSLADYYSSPDTPGGRFRQAWDKARSGEDQLFEWTSRRPADGTTFPAEISLHRIRLRDKDVIIASARDITYRKQAEEDLSEARKRAELYVDLMGHDINNLNQVGIGYLEMALDTLDGDDERKALLRQPLESMQHSSKLIDNVRLLQSIQAEGRRQEIKNIGSLLAEVKEEYTRIPDRAVLIDYRPVDDCHVMASPLLKEAFRNIVDNAVKHSAGQALIRITLEKTTGTDKHCYRISIEDSGPGIPDPVKEQLFTRSISGRARTRGSGLGLFIARILVEDAKGTIRVEDRIAGDYTKGSRFVITLPACGGR